MKKFEYKYDFDWYGANEFPVCENLNKMGEMGWELINVIPKPPAKAVYWFKREKI